MASPRTPIFTFGDWFYNTHASAQSSRNIAIRVIALVIPHNEWHHEHKFVSGVIMLPITLELGVIAIMVNSWSFWLLYAPALLFTVEWIREAIVIRQRERDPETGP